MDKPSEKIRQMASGMVQRNLMQIRDAIREREIGLYTGTGFFCPVCNSEFGSFAPAYAWKGHATEGELTGQKCVVVAPDGRCPGCDSLQRHRLLWKFLHEESELFDGRSKKLLEIAPDLPFFNLFSGYPYLHYFPCDIHPAQEKYDAFRGGIIEADVCDLPFNDEVFDVVLCSHVLEHVENDRRALAELQRVMKRGGWAVFQSPIHYNMENTAEDESVTSPDEREMLFGQADHLRKYGKDFKERIEDAGFRVFEIDFVHTFLPEEITRFGLDPYERIYHCLK
jgi:SAM-dependent methyltransferase